MNESQRKERKGTEKKVRFLRKHVDFIFESFFFGVSMFLVGVAGAVVSGRSQAEYVPSEKILAE